jgi:hypothetical protein
MNHEAAKALSPELQALINEPLSEPPPCARKYWRALDREMEKLEGVRAQQTSYDAEINRLRQELPLARQHDQQALSRAIAAGKDDPQSEADAIEAEIERNVKRSAAMSDVILKEQRRVAELVLRNKDKWAADLRRHLADGQAVYRAAIVALDQARAAFEEMVHVGGWLSPFPATAGQPPTALMPEKRLVPFTGRAESVVVPQRSFAEVLNDLRRDAEELPQRGPVRPSPQHLRELERKHIVAQSSDAEGNVRHQLLEGDTREGWAAKDLFERIRRG